MASHVKAHKEQKLTNLSYFRSYKEMKKFEPGGTFRIVTAYKWAGKTCLQVGGERAANV